LKQSPAWEAKILSLQEIPRKMRNPMVYNRTKLVQPYVCILSQVDPVH
jgi:hypothetical protein